MEVRAWFTVSLFNSFCVSVKMGLYLFHFEGVRLLHRFTGENSFNWVGFAGWWRNGSVDDKWFTTVAGWRERRILSVF